MPPAINSEEYRNFSPQKCRSFTHTLRTFRYRFPPFFSADILSTDDGRRILNFPWLGRLGLGLDLALLR